MPLDPNGIHQYEESEDAAPFSAMLNRLASSVSSRVATIMGRLAGQDERIGKIDQYTLAQNWVLRANVGMATKTAGTGTASGWVILQNIENRFTFDASNGTVTIPEDGLYMIFLTYAVTGPAGNRIRLSTGGDFERWGQTIQMSGASEGRVTLSTTLPLPAGAVFRPMLYSQAAGTNLGAELEIRRIG